MLLNYIKNHWPRRKSQNSKRIVILVHERTKSLHKYSIFRFTPTWIADGHKVIVARGTKRVVPGDLLIVHVDLSVVPERFLELASHYPVALNARVRDIRKSAISLNIVGPDSTWDGPVIVKSDLNFGGEPERKLFGFDKKKRTLRHHSDTPIHFGELDDYRIFDRIADVPARCFRDPGLVVEKFQPEIQDGFYHTRTCHILGESWHAYRHRSPNPLVKTQSVILREPIETHPDILALRRKIGLDYGKIDYVIHNGQAVLLDVNKTTGGGAMVETPELLAARARRARALYNYWPDDTPAAP